MLKVKCTKDIAEGFVEFDPKKKGMVLKFKAGTVITMLEAGAKKVTERGLGEVVKEA